jgi:hypothetical protein
MAFGRSIPAENLSDVSSPAHHVLAGNLDRELQGIVLDAAARIAAEGEDPVA